MSVAAAGEVVLDVLRVGGGELVLTAAQLGAERGERAGGQVGVEVGDHADGVRQAVAVLEGRAALVVDEHEVDLVGAVAHRQRGDERLQELGLAGAGGAGDEAVRAVGADVELEGPVVGLPDHRLRRTAEAGPALEQPPCVGLLQPEDLQQPAGAGQRAGEVLGGDVADRGERAGEPLEPQVLDQVGTDRVDGPLAGDLEVELVAVPAGDGAALLRELAHGLVEAEEEDAARGPLLEQRDHPRRHPDLAGAVEDDDAAGQAGPLLLLELPARLELGQQAAGLEGLGVVVGGQPHRARVVLGGAGVRQPLDPVPRRGRVGAGQHRQGDVGGTVHRGHLRDRPHRHGARLARPGRRSRRRRPSGT